MTLGCPILQGACLCEVQEVCVLKHLVHLNTSSLEKVTRYFMLKSTLKSGKDVPSPIINFPENFNPVQVIQPHSPAPHLLILSFQSTPEYVNCPN